MLPSQVDTECPVVFNMFTALHARGIEHHVILCVHRDASHAEVRVERPQKHTNDHIDSFQPIV